MRAVILALPFLAGCAALQAPPQPQATRLSAETLTVTLTDGTVCRADWVAAGGAGRLEPCGPGFDYRVTVEENPNLLRQVFTEITGALGAEGVVPPMAQVVVTDAAGRAFTFASPPPVE